MNWWPWFWGILFLIGLTGEIIALANNKSGDTLSENTWLWTQPHDGFKANVMAWIGRIVIGGFLVWLVFHMTAGWWTT